MIFFHINLLSFYCCNYSFRKTEMCIFNTQCLLKYRATHDKLQNNQTCTTTSPVAAHNSKYMSKRKKNTTQQNERKRIKSKREREGERESERK